jgi:Rad3-related DNA helicase
MRDLGVDLFFWEEVEQFQCNNKSQLTAREGYWIRHFRAWEDEFGYNKKVEQRTKAEYYQDKKEEIKQKSKTYHMNNIEKAKTFYNECKLCSCGNTYTVANKARHERSETHKKGLKE